MSTYEIIGIPDALAVAAVGVAFFLAIAPITAGHDFGVFKVPDFPATIKRWLRYVGPSLFVCSILLFVPFWNSPTQDPLPSGSKIEYNVGVHSTREERWLSDLGAYLENSNLDAGLKVDDFQVLVLETKPFASSTRKLTLSISPIHEKLTIASAYMFRLTFTTTQVLFVEARSARSDRGFEASELQFNEGDTLICLVNLQRTEGSVIDFPSTSQLNSSFEVTIK